MRADFISSNFGTANIRKYSLFICNNRDALSVYQKTENRIQQMCIALSLR